MDSWVVSGISEREGRVREEANLVLGPVGSLANSQLGSELFKKEGGCQKA